MTQPSSGREWHLGRQPMIVGSMHGILLPPSLVDTKCERWEGASSSMGELASVAVTCIHPVSPRWSLQARDQHNVSIHLQKICQSDQLKYQIPDKLFSVNLALEEKQGLEFQSAAPTSPDFPWHLGVSGCRRCQQCPLHVFHVFTDTQLEAWGISQR